MEKYYATGTYASRAGRMLSFMFCIEAYNMDDASEQVMDIITSRKAYAGKLSFDLVTNAGKLSVDLATNAQEV